MSHYREVETKVWDDDKFVALSKPRPNAQTLWLYLLTGRETLPIPGVLRVGQAGLAEALGWSTVALQRCWREIESSGMARADWPARLVWLPRTFEHGRHKPVSLNQVKSWRKAFDGLPPSALKGQIDAAVERVLGQGHPTFTQAWRGTREVFRDGKAEAKADGKADGKDDGKRDALRDAKVVGQRDGPAEAFHEAKAEAKTDGNAEGKAEAIPQAKGYPETETETETKTSTLYRDLPSPCRARGAETEPDASATAALWETWIAAAGQHGVRQPLTCGPREYHHLCTVLALMTLDEARTALHEFWRSPRFDGGKRKVGMFAANAAELLAHALSGRAEPFGVPPTTSASSAALPDWTKKWTEVPS